MDRAIGVILAFIVFVATGATQEAIQFAPWSEVNQSDVLIEYSASFPSPFTSNHPENDTVPVRAFLPVAVSTPPVVLVLHYWGASDQRTELAVANDLARKGVATVLIALPYHLGRTPKGFRSGELAILPDPNKLVATMKQGAADVRRAIDWIESRPEFDRTRIGITGTSLGSMVAALVYGLESRIKCAAFILGGGDVAHVLWHSSRVVSQRDALRRQGYTESKLRELLVDVEPLTYLPRAVPRPALVIGAKFDTVVPPEDVRKLLNQLPGAQSLWLETGHYGGIFVQRRVQRVVADFFATTFEGKIFVAPKHINAPTIRISVGLNSATSLQVGLGLDVWKTPRGHGIACLLATPKGIQGFVGYRVSQGLHLGGFVSARRVGVGIFWSTVL